MRIVPYLAAWLIALTGIATAQSVGVTSAVNQSAVGIPPSQKPKTIFMGEQIIHNEKITTDSKGLLQILLADGTSFTVGPNSSMSIDSFVYDPDAGSAKVVATLGKGVFRFIGGKSSKSPDGVTLNTPVGTVGVRGGISNLDFSGATAYHVDMIYGDGITLKDGTQIIGNIYHSGYSIVIGTDGKTSVVKTPPGWAEQFQTLMAGQGDGDSNTSKQVADNVSKGDSGKPPGSPPGTSGGGTTPPPTGPNSTDTSKVALVGPSTWNQIDNSTLKGAGATYNGSYSATLSVTTPGHHGPATTTSSIDNAGFALDYSFATRNGVAKFDLPVPLFGHSSLDVPVYADDHDGAGVATFSNKLIVGNSHTIFGSSSTISGGFLNTDGQVATGVAGTFDSTQHLLGIQADLNGAFAGTR
jgi:hypothetical protein